MMIRAGVQTFDFQQSFEMPKPLNFATDEDALHWLKRLWSQHPDLIFRFREYLAQYSSDPESSRLTDHQAIERLAVLLHSRRVLVIARETRAARAQSPRSETPAPPFPLSERKPRAPAKWKDSKTWIAIQLKDSDGNPVAGENYKLELPDGQMVEGSLDGMGMAAVTGIDPGQCKVSFPRLDGSAWALTGSRAG
jgi:hypothetical protein